MSLDPERRAAILARHERDSARYALSALTPNELRIRAREARADRADLLAAYDQITLERDNSEKLHGDGHAFWQGKFMEQHKRAEAAEAALVVLTHALEEEERFGFTLKLGPMDGPMRDVQVVRFEPLKAALRQALAGDGGPA